MTRQYVLLLALAVTAATGSGCSTGTGLSSPYSAGPRDYVTNRWRDHVWANRAYETKIAGSMRGRMHETDYRRGFVAGYQSVSQGGDGTVPPMPPRRYWGSEYLSPEGQTKAKSWFEGFPDGVRAAQEDGIDAYRDIYVSQLLDDLNRLEPGMYPETGRHMLGLPPEDQLLPGGHTTRAWDSEVQPPDPMELSSGPTMSTEGPSAAVAAGLPVPIGRSSTVPVGSGAPPVGPTIPIIRRSPN